MEDASILNMSAYIRKMALDVICIRLDVKGVRQLVILLRRGRVYRFSGSPKDASLACSLGAETTAFVK